MKKYSKIQNLTIIFCFSLFVGCDKSKRPIEDIETIIPFLNNKFCALLLEKVKLPVVDSKKSPTITISIITKDKVSFPFEEGEYFFPPNSIGLMRGKEEMTESMFKISALIDSIYMRDDKIFDILRKLETSVSLEKVGLKIEQKINTGHFLAEFATVIKHIYDFEFKKLRIYIKGYADYSRNKKFYGIQTEENGMYTRLMVHPALDTGNQMLFYYDYEEERVAKSDTFRNKDLPNLRAAYIKEILEKFVDFHIKKNKLYRDTKVEILDGSVVGLHPDSTQRRGEVIIQVFE